MDIQTLKRNIINPKLLRIMSSFGSAFEKKHEKASICMY